MRILLAIQELGQGGAERVVHTLRAGAERAGHDVTVAAAPELPLVERRVTRIPGAARALRRAIRSSAADILHCQNPGIALVGSLATRRGRRPPTLVTVHGVPDEDYGHAARVLRIAGLPSVACGPGVALALAEVGFAVRETIVNGVAEPPAPADRAALLADLGLADGVPLLVAVGRLVEQKDHALAIRALAHVPGAALVVVGDGPLRGELEREAERVGVSDRAVIAGNRPDARPIIGAADLLVLSSRWEGLPLVVLEALAAGTPVVATDVRGVRQLLTDGRDSLLVPHGDAEAMAGAIRRVLSEPTLAAALVTEGRSLAAGYTNERMVEAYLRLYEELAR